MSASRQKIDEAITPKFLESALQQPLQKVLDEVLRSLEAFGPFVPCDEVLLSNRYAGTANTRSQLPESELMATERAWAYDEAWVHGTAYQQSVHHECVKILLDTGRSCMEGLRYWKLLTPDALKILMTFKRIALHLEAIETYKLPDMVECGGLRESLSFSRWDETRKEATRPLTSSHRPLFQ